MTTKLKNRPALGQIEWQAVRERVLAKMSAKKLTITQIANAMGYKPFEIRRWIAKNANEPRATVALRLKEWADQRTK